MRFKEFLEYYMPHICDRWADDVEFVDIHFAEALQNYTDIVCEKQRRNCLKNTENAYDHLTYMNGIINAEQPKIDEL